MGYTRRLIDSVLDEYMQALPAIALEGAKGVGKTATGLQRASSTLAFDDPAVRASAEADWHLVTRVEPPVLVDEWQLVPSVWDRVRRAVDEGADPGSYLLAGSADAPSDARIHSGAGRTISLHMRPLSFAERGVQTPTVSLAELASGVRPEITGSTPVGFEAYELATSST